MISVIEKTKSPAIYPDEMLKDEEHVEINSCETVIWEHCISSEFPIMNMEVNDNIATCKIGPPHQGYIMDAEIDDNYVPNGEATIRNCNGETRAVLHYEKGKETGACKLYYESGKLYFSGYLRNGYRNGRGIEYDEAGKVIFYGFYKNGKRIPNITRNVKKEEYWNEEDSSGIVSVCQKDYRGFNYGICYVFKNNKIAYISRWKDGIEVERLYKFHKDKMKIYQRNKEIYNESYVKISDFEYMHKGSIVFEGCASKKYKGKRMFVFIFGSLYVLKTLLLTVDFYLCLLLIFIVIMEKVKRHISPSLSILAVICIFAIVVFWMVNGICVTPYFLSKH